MSSRLTYLAPLLITSLVLVGCASDSPGGGVERPYSSCAGACDAPGDLPILEPIDLSRLIECVAILDPGTGTFVQDELDCQLRLPGIQNASFSASLTARNEDASTYDEGIVSSANNRTTLRVRRAAYPIDITADLRIGLPGSQTTTFPMRVTVFSYEEFRDYEVNPLVFGLPAEAWPIRIWPDTDVQERWVSSIRSISARADGSVAVSPELALTTRARETASGSTFAVERIPDQLYFHLPGQGGGGGGTVNIDMYVRGGERITAESVIDGPGYWLLGSDGFLRRTAVEDLPFLPGYAGYGTPAAVEPDPEPIAIPDEPCSGTCLGDEVCVAGGCVRRSGQTQNAGECSRPGTAACDDGEDLDCAEVHVCIEGRCTNLACQRQVHPDCPPPSASCVDADDCYPGHECVGGRCAANVCNP